MKCEICGQEASTDRVTEISAGNSEKSFSIRVSEEELSLLAGTLGMANMRYGMYGHGILANRLGDLMRELRKFEDPMMRNVDEGEWAQALHAHDIGYRMEIFLMDGTGIHSGTNVVIGGYSGPEDKKGKVFAKVFVRKDEVAEDKLAFFENFFEKRTPKPRVPKVEKTEEDPAL